VPPCAKHKTLPRLMFLSQCHFVPNTKHSQGQSPISVPLCAKHKTLPRVMFLSVPICAAYKTLPRAVTYLSATLCQTQNTPKSNVPLSGPLCAKYKILARVPTLANHPSFRYFFCPVGEIKLPNSSEFIRVTYFRGKGHRICNISVFVVEREACHLITNINISPNLLFNRYHESLKILLLLVNNFLTKLRTST
jgi:hypothetical protein